MTDPAASCFGKAVYFSEKKAKEVRRICEAKRPETPLRVYRCAVGGFWHLTKTVKYEGS